MTLLRLDAGEASLVLSARTGAPARVLHLGARLPAGIDLAPLEALRAEGRRESQPDDPRPLPILPTTGFGFLGAPGLVVAGAAGASPLDLLVVSAEQANDRIGLALADDNIRVRIEVSAVGAIFRWETRLENTGAEPLALLQLASLCAPAPDFAQEIWTYSGRWGNEHRLSVDPLPHGQFVKEGRSGRTGFESAAYLALAEAGASEDRGRVCAVALDWSGDARLLVEQRMDGVRQMQIGLRLDAGEVGLAPGEAFAAPAAFLAYTARGRNGVRAAFHPFARARAAQKGPRKVHFNTWEAAYFDVSAERLPPLIAAAAELGVERFVLDDGWFKGRRDDRTSLGDWTPDPERFPDGLAPVAAACAAHGLDFGLWVEPEMASPDSDLMRAHPDWALGAKEGARPTQRGQLVLDFSRAEVRAYILAALDALLASAPIAYLKWDHNRDLFPAYGAGPSARAQTLGVYDVIDQLRARWPAVEIETCASGGGRADYGMLGRTQRVWASDDVDALERARIQRDLSLFVPPAMIGAHVGASPDHTTGRRLSMTTRARAALFFHMGVEADPTRLSEGERAELAQAIAFYKASRAILHEGDFAVLASAVGVIGWRVIAADGQAALAFAVRLDHAAEAVSEPLKIAGLDPRANYRVRLLDPWPPRGGRRIAQAVEWKDGLVLAGALIAEVGVPVPLIHPGETWLLDVVRV
ncbi:MAG: alpha-galactosidase [Caulobacterales bacterium]